MTVDYATADGTRHAAALGLRQRRSGTLTFAAGPDHQDSSSTSRRPARRDRRDFLLNLSNAADATIADARASARSPTTTRCRRSRSTTYALTEGDGTLTHFTLPDRQPAHRHRRLRDGDGTATAPADYHGASGTSPSRRPDHAARHRAGHGDRSTRSTRRSSSTSRTRRTRRSPTAGRRHDHRRRPAARRSINDVTVTEGDAGRSTRPSRSAWRASGRPVTVDYATANGTATAPADYQTAAGTVTFAAGQTTQQVTVQVNGDLLDEATRPSRSTSRAPSTRRSPSQGLGTITDNDPLPALSVNDVTVTEGDSARRTQPSPSP